MRIAELLTRRRSVGVEFFPPRTSAGWARLEHSIGALQALPLDYASVTYGAGGGTRESTHRLISKLCGRAAFAPVAHLTCVCHTQAEIDAILERYVDCGVENIMALGGDPPKERPCTTADFFYAIDLVQHIVASWPGRFCIGVAGFPEGHPATPNRVTELRRLQTKVDAGSDYICTQLFFDNRDFFDFRDRCRLVGIRVPILAGLMPIVSRRMYERIPDLALGARYPAALIRRIEACHSDDEIAAVGLEWTVAQCRQLIAEGVAGLHFYSLNRLDVTRALLQGLGLQ